MGVYFRLAAIAFRQKNQYRMNTFIYVIGNFLLLFVMVNVWETLLRTGAWTANSVKLSDMVAFVVLNMLIQALLKSDITSVVSRSVGDGSIANELLKPVHYQVSSCFMSIGESVFEAIYKVLPVCAMAAILYSSTFPASPERTALFSLSVLLGIGIMRYIQLTLGLLAFWIQQIGGYVNWILDAVFKLFAGTVVPLWFYPEKLYALCSVLPFRFVAYEPIQIYLGKLTRDETITVLVVQVLWLGGLAAVNLLLWRSARKNLEVNGG